MSKLGSSVHICQHTACNTCNRSKESEGAAHVQVLHHRSCMKAMVMGHCTNVESHKVVSCVTSLLSAEN